MAKKVPIVSSKVSLRDLTSYKQIFKMFGHLFERNSINSKPTEKPSTGYLCEECTVCNNVCRALYPSTVSLPLEPDYYGPSTRVERELEEMNERDYSENLLIENSEIESH